MRIGSEDKSKVRLMVFLLITAMGLAVYRHQPEKPEPQKAGASKSVAHREIALPATLEFNSSGDSEQNTYEPGRRNPFQFQNAIVEKKPPDTLKLSGPELKQGEILPPIPLKFYGFARKHRDLDWIFLQDDQEIFVARPGDTVERRYKVLEVKENSAVVLDLLNNNRETLPLIRR
jgi:hypothetical protein